MNCLRRPVALLAAILFQLMLAGGAYGCVTMGGLGSGKATMAGMRMPELHGTERLPSPAGDDELPCGLPWAPDGCQSVAPCTVAMVAASSEKLLSRAPRLNLPTLELLVPASLSLAPELPPPRA